MVNVGRFSFSWWIFDLQTVVKIIKRTVSKILEKTGAVKARARKKAKAVVTTQDGRTVRETERLGGLTSRRADL